MHSRTVGDVGKMPTRIRDYIEDLAKSVGRLLLVVGLVGLSILTVGAAENDNEKCPNKADWKPSRAELITILNEHGKWVAQEGWKNPDLTGKAILCNADLRGHHLEYADLRGADLRGANLQSVNLIGTNLGGANLQTANLALLDLSRTRLGGANLQQANLSGANLRAVNFTTFDVRPFLADLNRATLTGADLRDANLFAVDLSGAHLLETDLRGADLSQAKLRRARLKSTKLNGALLFYADLQDSQLLGTDLEGAALSFANLKNAIYQPISAPSSGHLSGLKGVATLQFGPGGQTGLVLLRKALQEAGLRELERKATYAIEHGVNEYALAGHGDGAEYERGKFVRRDRIAMIEGSLKLIFFEWTTDWGLRPERALFILVGGIGFFSVFYFVALSPPELTGGVAGIYRIWPDGRIADQSPSDVAEDPAPTRTIADKAELERLEPKFWGMIGFALYFSLQSAFSIGWRDLNVGSWLTKLQPREYGLRARGWVRVVSGLQSLVSVYLVAIAVLTYFGRPFQ